MTRNDPSYEYFRADAQRYIENPDSPINSVADYFRHFGIVPPANYGRPAYKDREVMSHDYLDSISQRQTWTGAYSIYKPWGEPGPTLLQADTTSSGDEGDD